jgi:cation:H+ antiporter
MLIAALLLLFGLVLLTIGADKFVEGASSLAKKFGMSELAIGLTVVAFGTSAPELIVNIMASVNGSNGLAYGNIIGSNSFNLLLILGIAGMIYPLSAHPSLVRKDILYSLLAAVAVFILVNDNMIMGADTFAQTVVNKEGQSITTTYVGISSRLDGIILAVFFAYFLYYVFTSAKSGDAPSGEEEVQELSPVLTWLYLLGGLGALVVGGHLIVTTAVFLATEWGMSEKMIGLTIVSAGTSLPELATSAIAAYRKKSDIAIANVIGSNIFNIFFVLSTSAIIAPIPFEAALNIDIYVLLAATVVLWIFLRTSTGRQHTPQEIDIMDNPELIKKGAKEYVFQRWQAFLFLLAYLAYTYFLIRRG